MREGGGVPYLHWSGLKLSYGIIERLHQYFDMTKKFLPTLQGIFAVDWPGLSLDLLKKGSPRLDH